MLYGFMLNKHVTYLSCSCYMHMNNLEVVATSRYVVTGPFSVQGVYCLQYKHLCPGETSAYEKFLEKLKLALPGRSGI